MDILRVRRDKRFASLGVITLGVLGDLYGQKILGTIQVAEQDGHPCYECKTSHVQFLSDRLKLAGLTPNKDFWLL